MATTLHLPLLCLALLAWGDVTSFSIRHRAERSANTNLADALAMYQRQRRRVDANYLDSSPDGLLDDQPLTLQDVSDWLSDAGAGSSRTGSNSIDEDDVVSNWIPGLGEFKDFEPSDMRYDLNQDAYPSSPVKASHHEIEAIFEPEANDMEVERRSPSLSKKKKEEMLNVKGDKTVIHKPALKPVHRKRDSSSEQRILSSLTREEVKVLMKAVGKLQKQLGEDDNDDGDNELASVFGDVDIDNDDVDEPIREEEFVVSEPVSEEELESVFTDTEGPLTEETKVSVVKEPGKEEPTIMEEKVISEQLPEMLVTDDDEEVEDELTEALTSELENELQAERESEREAAKEAAEDVAAAAVAAARMRTAPGEDVEDGGILDNDDEDDDEDVDEELSLGLNDAQKLATKYWLLNGDTYFNQPEGNMRRPAKRASGVFLDNVSDDASSGRVPEPSLPSEHLGKAGNQAQINLSWLSPQLQEFVRKIMSLQDEVDRLRMEARLEDMENEALTDALNEATLAQMQGTVTDLEWSSLQKAIQLEAALQDIKHQKPSSTPDDDALSIETEEVADEPVMSQGLKRGRSWRNRQPDVMKRTNDVSDEDYPLALFGSADDADLQDDAMDKLLEESYFLKGSPDDVEEGSMDIASLFTPNPEQCPAVRRYSTNCALADVYDLPVDFEARALCNLHEMCYACGKSLGVELSQCDLVYTTAASSLCKREAKCEEEARVFLGAMKLKNRYIAHAQPSCRSKCTAEFLGMF